MIPRVEPDGVLFRKPESSPDHVRARLFGIMLSGGRSMAGLSKPTRHRRSRLGWSLGCAVGGLLLTGTAALAVTKLTPKEIQDAFFNGQPFVSSTPSNIKFRMVFMADGKMTREPVSRAAGVKGEGTWKLSKDGFCTSWKGSKSTCFTLVNVEDNKWSVVRGATTVATWSKDK